MHAVSPQPAPDPDAAAAGKEPLPKSMDYLRRIISLTKERDVSLLLIAAPFSATPDERLAIKRVAELSEAQGCAFIDYNRIYDEINLDFSTDLCNREHLNASGAAKLTRHLGAYIRARYDVPDRRGEPRYAGWDSWAAQAEAFVAAGGAL
jgi:hypothetical protein